MGRLQKSRLSQLQERFMPPAASTSPPPPLHPFSSLRHHPRSDLPQGPHHHVGGRRPQALPHRDHPHRRQLGSPSSTITVVCALRAFTRSLTGDRALARRYLELGASFVAVGIDITLMAQAARALAAEFGVGTAPQAVEAEARGPY